MEEEASLKRKHPQGEEVFVGAKRSKVEESISAEERPEVLLPPEIWFHVFSLLPEQTLLSTVGCVCHEWYGIRSFFTHLNITYCIRRSLVLSKMASFQLNLSRPFRQAKQEEEGEKGEEEEVSGAASPDASILRNLMLFLSTNCARLRTMDIISPPKEREALPIELEDADYATDLR